MARIIVPLNTLVGLKLISLNNSIVQAAQEAVRLKAIVDQITASGVTTANLESSTEAKMPVGSGAALYAGIGQIVTALNGLAQITASIDQG